MCPGYTVRKFKLHETYAVHVDDKLRCVMSFTFHRVILCICFKQTLQNEMHYEAAPVVWLVPTNGQGTLQQLQHVPHPLFGNMCTELYYTCMYVLSVLHVHVSN